MSSIAFLDTKVVIPVSVKQDNDKYKDHFYMVENHSDFPTLGITISYGFPTNLTPTESLKGYKTKAISQNLYRPLITVTFDRNFQPSLEEHTLVHQPIGKGGQIASYGVDGSKTELVVDNHMDVVNRVVLPQAIQKISDPTRKSARFSSWVLVGIELLGKMHKALTVTGENKDLEFKQELASITQQDLFSVVFSTANTLTANGAYVSESHKQIASRIQALPGYSESKAIEASVSKVVDKDATQADVAVAEKPKNK